MKSVLISHAGDEIDEKGLPLWLASFSDLAGVIIVHEPKRRLLTRIRREWARSALFGFLDVLAFRAYYRVWFAQSDRERERRIVAELFSAYASPVSAEILSTKSPNSPEVKAFLSRLAPDIMIARCKTLLKKEIFTIPRCGTFVMHPGTCPEYRNAHGCFWALANGENDKVAMTLLQIDEGIDTGPVYGYFTCDYDPARDSHIKIQTKTVTDNLDAIRLKLLEIAAGTAESLDVSGRMSREWGQPKLSAYLRWRRRAQIEAKNNA